MSDWMKTLQKMTGAVDKAYDPFAPENVIKTGSPSFNWIFEKGGGLPLGYTAIAFGQPKSGKSLLCNLMAGACHAQYPDGIVVKFNTEMREAGQMEDYWGIDQSRYMAYDVNEPELIFDRIKNELLPMCQAGMPLRLILIDSLKGISGVKEQNRDSITGHLIGDHAKTIQDGLKAILPTLRRQRISLLCTEHVRANQEAGMYGPKEKMAGGWAEKHFFEYYIKVTKDNSAEGKKSLDGESLEDNTIKDFKGKGETLGRKVFFKMTDSTVSKPGRTGQMTLTFADGLVNTHEEIFEMAKNTGSVERPNNRTYIYEGQNYTSKGDFLKALKENEELAKSLLATIQSRDIRKKIS